MRRLLGILLAILMMGTPVFFMYLQGGWPEVLTYVKSMGMMVLFFCCIPLSIYVIRLIQDN